MMEIEYLANLLENLEDQGLPKADRMKIASTILGSSTEAEIGFLVRVLSGEPELFVHEADNLAPTPASVLVAGLQLPPPLETLVAIISDAAVSGRNRHLDVIWQAETQLSFVGRKWLYKFIRKDIARLLTDREVLEALAHSLEEKRISPEVLFETYKTRCDLAHIAKLIKSKGPEILSEVRPIPGIPVFPESQHRVTSSDIDLIWERFGPCYVHTKHDGFRCQIHKQREEVQLFVGRHLANWTTQLPGIVEAVRHQIPAQEAILESELVPIQSPGGLPVKRSQFHMARWHKAVVWDLLFVDGDDLRECPYQERLKRKRGTLRPPKSNSYLEPSNDIFVQTRRELEAIFADSISNHMEGLIVVNPSSRYLSSFPSGRSSDRLKLKKTDPIDAVIVGYDLSGQTDGSKPISFMLAVYDEIRNEYATICRAKSGLTAKQRDAMAKRCKSLDNSQSKRLLFLSTPDVVVAPDAVVEIEIDYIHPSRNYSCGLRDEGTGYGAMNARFISGAARNDKRPDQATTVREFLNLRHESGQQIVNEDPSVDDHQLDHYANQPAGQLHLL